MQVRWSPKAYEDLAAIGSRIREDDPEAALRVITTIYDNATALKAFPNRGRNGRVEGTRELPLPPLPFIVVYRVLSEAVESSTLSTAHNYGLKRGSVNAFKTAFLNHTGCENTLALSSDRNN